MAEASACPLCTSSHLSVLQSIASRDVVALFAGSAVEPASEFGALMRLEYLRCQNCDLRFFWPAVTGSERFYDQLQGTEQYYQEEKPEFDFARRYLNNDDVLLEVGCGAGAFGASTRVKRYVGLEFSAKAASAARAKGLMVLQETIEAHSQANPGHYDAVCAFQVLEHTSTPHSFLRSCLAALKPSGCLIVSVPSVDSFARGVINFALDLPPHHVTRWSDRCLNGVSRVLPLELVELWHEPLQAVHRRLYVTSAVTRFGYRLLRREPPAVETGACARLLAMSGSKISRIIAPALSMFPARGISVTAIYRKLKKLKGR